MIKSKIFTSLLIVSILLGTLMIWKIPEANASEYTLGDLEQQITDALDWLDRMVYIEINSTHAVATDTPQLSFRVKHSDGKWTISGKTREENLPNGADMIKGWAYVEDASDRGVITSYVDKASMLYKWDLDDDGNYNNLLLYVEYATINDSWTQLYGKVDSFSGEQSITYDLYLETDKLISTIAKDKTFTRTKEWGWPGSRYTIRPTVKGLADLYYNLATISYPWLGGQTYAEYRDVDYADRALKLYRTWYGSGYIIDRFDGQYGTCALSRPFPEIAKYNGTSIPPNPDLILEPTWNALLDQYEIYYTNSPLANWYNYSNAPSPTYGINNVLRFVTVSRHVMPENEEWPRVPFQCTDSSFIFPYKSRTGFEWARNAYIANGMAYDLINYNGYSLVIPGPEGDVCLGYGPDCASIRACEDMYKYGKDIPYGLTTLKTEFIDSSLSVWDGNGFGYVLPSVGTALGTLTIPVPMAFAAYGTHNTATFGNALVQYYKITGDEYYATKADEVVGVLTMIQNKLGKSVESRNRNQEFYRAEYVGSFLPGYGVAYSFGQQDVYTTDWVDWIYGGLKLFGIFEEDPQPLTYPCLGNAEVTIPSVWTMIEYRTLNRIPKVPDVPDYVLPLNNVVVYTDHGGSYGGDGSTEICNDAVATKIGGATGNLWKYVGNINRFRMTAVAAVIQQAWATIEYDWNFTLTQPVTNWRTKLYFTTPYLQGSGGNSLGVWVELYNSKGTLVVSESKIPLNGYAETSGFGKMFFYNNLTCLYGTLPAGTYTIKLKFKCHAGYGQLYLGYQYCTITGDVWKCLPMGLECFGYDCDPAYAPPIITYNLNIQSVGPGSTSPSGLQNYAEGTTATITATPNSGKYFWNWNVNNTRLGYSHNYFTANPMYLYMDHDYNLTAYFGDTSEPPPPYRQLTIYVGTSFGTTSPSPGNHSYAQGTLVTATAIPYSGYVFKGWRLDSSYYTSNSISITMDTDHFLVAFFQGTTIYFTIYNSLTNVQLLDGVTISCWQSGGWKQIGTVVIGGYIATLPYSFPAGIYDFKFDKSEYYTIYAYSVTIPSATVYFFPTVYMDPIGYSGGGGGGHYYPKSSLIIFYATIPYSGTYTQVYWIDPQGLIYVEPYFNTTATIKIIVHYETNYFPVVEIEANNVAYVKFNITEFYQAYAGESYKQKLDTNHWTGFHVQSDRHLLLEVTGFPYKPLQVFHCDNDGEVTELEDWNWIPGDSAILLDKFSTVSLTFGEPPNMIGIWIPVLVSLMMVLVALELIKRYMNI